MNTLYKGVYNHYYGLFGIYYSYDGFDNLAFDSPTGWTWIGTVDELVALHGANIDFQFPARTLTTSDCDYDAKREFYIMFKCWYMQSKDAIKRSAAARAVAS